MIQIYLKQILPCKVKSDIFHAYALCSMVHEWKRTPYDTKVKSGFFSLGVFLRNEKNKMKCWPMFRAEHPYITMTSVVYEQPCHALIGMFRGALL